MSKKPSARQKRIMWERRALKSGVRMDCAGCKGPAHSFLELAAATGDQAARRAPVCDYCRRYFRKLESPEERQMFLRHLEDEMRRRDSGQRISDGPLYLYASEPAVSSPKQHPWRRGSLKAPVIR